MGDDFIFTYRLLHESEPHSKHLFVFPCCNKKKKGEIYILVWE